MFLAYTPGDVRLEYSFHRFQGHLKSGKLRTCEAVVRIVVRVQLESDQYETHPDPIRTLSDTVMRLFVNDPYRDAVPQQCECNSQSGRATANLMQV